MQLDYYRKSSATSLVMYIHCEVMSPPAGFMHMLLSVCYCQIDILEL